MIKIGSRASKLALIQANIVKDILKKEGFDVQIVEISTKGDRNRDKKIDQLNSKGVFVREIEEKLLDKTIDVAVHSLKDMPSEINERLVFTPPLKGEDPRDSFVGKEVFKKMDDLNNAFVGTGSNRRICQGKNYFSNIKFKAIRGNVETRIKKIQTENLCKIWTN